MDLEQVEGHYMLRLTRDEAEEIYAAMLVEMVTKAELSPLRYWAKQGVFGSQQLASDDLAHRILQYKNIVGPPYLLNKFLTLGIDNEDIEGVIVSKPTSLETIAQIEGMEAYQRAYDSTIKKQI